MYDDYSGRSHSMRRLSERDQLLEQLAQANKRLSGTLRIVLGSLDAHDLTTLFDRVLDELRDTMSASASAVWIFERDALRLRGVSNKVDVGSLPRVLDPSQGFVPLALERQYPLRLQLEPPTQEELRQGALEHRSVVDETTGVRLELKSTELLPFASSIVVPVFFANRPIALMTVGWRHARVLSDTDAELLDAVARYLSVQLMAALNNMRTRKSNLLEHALDRFHDHLAAQPALTHQALNDEVALCASDFGATLVVLSCAGEDAALQLDVQGGVVELPLVSDIRAQLDTGGVYPLYEGSELSAWLAQYSSLCLGALMGAGMVDGAPYFALLLRSVEDGPFDDIELSCIKRSVTTVHDLLAGELVRTKDKRISQALQTGMRNALQKVEGLTAQALYSSATEDAFVGGDFFDLIRLPERHACVIMGDVSGKGVEAASVSAAVRTALGAYAWVGMSPAAMVRSLNHFLLGFSRIETFATLFVGIIDMKSATLTYCSAGHPPALLLRSSSGELISLDVQSGVVGAFEGMLYQDGVVQLDKHDTLVLYTDGVTEARSPEGAFFGEDGLREELLRHLDAAPTDILDALLNSLDRFTHRQLEDDVAMLAIRFDELGE